MERMHSSDELVRPGVYVETAIEAVPDILDRTIRFMRRNPDPISWEAQAKFCRRLASLAVFEFPDTEDADENRAYFVKGMQWGYGLAVSSGLKQPILNISRHGLSMSSEDKMTMLRDNIRNYGNESRDLLSAFMGELYQDIDSAVRYPNMVFWGFASALYMVDQGERNKFLKEREDFALKRMAAEQADFDMAFNMYIDETVQEQKAADTVAWYALAEQLQGEGLWADEL